MLESCKKHHLSWASIKKQQEGLSPFRSLCNTLLVLEGNKSPCIFCHFQCEFHCESSLLDVSKHRGQNQESRESVIKMLWHKGFLRSKAIKILCQRAIIISYIKFMHPYLIVCGPHNFMGSTLWEELYIYPMHEILFVKWCKHNSNIGKTQGEAKFLHNFYSQH